MNVAVVVVCPQGLLDDAAEWGERGLVAESLWVVSDNAAAIDADRPNSLHASRISPENGVHEPSPLARTLAELGALDEVRVAWIRSADDQLTEQLKTLEYLLRDLLPEDLTLWFDIVIPSRRTEATLAPLPGQWVRLRILPEDRSAPDVTDAGWDLDLQAPLHGVLAALGILGGVTQKLPWDGLDAGRHYEFRAFSRIVLGATDASLESDAFVGTEIPEGSAGTFHPHRYLQLDDPASRDLVSDAVAFTLALNDRALTYSCPPTSHFAPPPRIKRRQHIKNFLSFLLFGLMLLAKLRAAPQAVVHSKYDFTDLGYNVEEPRQAADWGIQVPDFQALDRALAERAARDIDQQRRDLNRNPPTPNAGVWRAIVQLSTGLVDGGPRPAGWEPPDHHGRRPALHPAWVQSGEGQTVTSAVPEIAAARNHRVRTVAIQEASRRRQPALAAPDNLTGVVATARQFATEGNHEDEARLGTQLSEIGEPEAVAPGGFLDMLLGTVLGAELRARLDAERWGDLATGDRTTEGLDWSAAERRFRKRTWIGLAACAGVTVIWIVLAILLRDVLPGWLTMSLGLVAVAVIAVTFVVASLTVFFRTYYAYLERGRRRLEMRGLWTQRALLASTEWSRLSSGRKVLEKWVDILALIFPVARPTLQPPHRSLPDRAPKGTVVAKAVHTETEMRAWLVGSGGEVGWRGRALQSMAAESTRLRQVDALHVILADEGLPGGPLHQLWARRHDLWAGCAAEVRKTTSAEVARRIVGSDQRRLEVLGPGARAGQRTELGAFLGEPWPTPEDDDAHEWVDGQDRRLEGSRAASDGSITGLAPDVAALRVRIQTRPEGTVAPSVRPPHVEADSEDGTW